MYFDDHGPPHFHARHAEGSAKVRIDTLEPIESDLGRRQLRLVLAWAELHRDELLENWHKARAGETDAYARHRNHQRAMHTLGAARLRVLWRCWQDQTPYNPTRDGALTRQLARAR